MMAVIEDTIEVYFVALLMFRVVLKVETLDQDVVIGHGDLM